MLSVPRTNRFSLTTILVFRFSFIICVNNHFGLMFPCDGISARTVLLTSLSLQLLWFVKFKRRNWTCWIRLLLDLSFPEWTVHRTHAFLSALCSKGSVSGGKWLWGPCEVVWNGFFPYGLSKNSPRESSIPHQKIPSITEYAWNIIRNLCLTPKR